MKVSLSRPAAGLSIAFRNSALSTKLAVIILVTASLALLLAGIGFLSYEGIRYRAEAERDMAAVAEIVARSNTAALSFNDQGAARETLAALRGDLELLQAVVYDRNGVPFAEYRAPGASIAAPPRRPRPDGVYFEGATALVFRPVMLGAERLGTVLIQHSMSQTLQRLKRYAGIVVIVLGASLFVAFLVVARLQRVITAPIASLADVARRVSTEKDFSIRAKKQANDEIGLLIDSFNDMLSQIQRGQLALRESEERYSLAVQGANDGLWDWKPVTNEIYLSPRWKSMLGYSDSEIRSDPEEWFSRIHPGDRERVKSEMTTRKNAAEPVFATEYRIRTRGGVYIWVLCRGIALRDASGTIIRMAGSQTDVTEGKIVDPLTGLRTRLYFLDKLESLIKMAGRSNYTFAVLFLGLDRFKVVNDSLGHEAGDRLLIEVAGQLRSSVRATDGATRLTDSTTIARFGGDEFAVLLENIHGQTDAVAVAKRIVGQFGSPFNIGGHLIFATFSIGIAMGNSGGTSTELLRNADTAMYYAKTRGKSRFEVFNEEMRERAVARMELESDLRSAVNEGQFTLYYQPEVSLQTGKVVGYEALVRWNHPRRGLMLPSEFLDIAQETGLIIPLGQWVMREACRQMAQWQKQFPQEPPLSISVNLSTPELASPDLIAGVARTLEETGLNPKTLRIEVTESSIIEDKGLALSVLRRLKELRVSLEIDDFGTGYSSLSRLHEFPFDTVKIDRSFVADLEAGTGSRHFVETILSLAHSLGMSVVVEGVETRGQKDVLTALGCSSGQGFYFSRPVDSQTTQQCIQDSARPGGTAIALLPGSSESTEVLAGPGGAAT